MGITTSKAKDKIYYSGGIVKTSLGRVYSIVESKHFYKSKGCCDTVITGQKSMYLKELLEDEVNTTKIEHFFAKRGGVLVYMYSVDTKREQEKLFYDHSRTHWVKNRYNQRMIKEHMDEYITNEDEPYVRFQDTSPFLLPKNAQPGDPEHAEGYRPSAPSLETTVR